MKKKWVSFLVIVFAFAILFGSSPTAAMAVKTGNKTIDNEVHYQINGAIDAGVRYWSIEYDSVDENGSIILNGTKFADRSNQWGLSKTEPYAGKFLLNFHRVEFYEQIQSISIINGNTVTEFDKEANGALWSVPINTKTWSSGLIGVVTNSKIKITLKNGQTLERLNLENTPISFETFAVTGSGNPDGSNMMANRSWDQGFILLNNKNKKDEYKTGFVTGSMSNRISIDYNQITGQMVIKSIHSFKPNLKMSVTDLYWVIYIKEQIPKELLPYIDTANIRLGATNEEGKGDKAGTEFRTNTPVTIDVDGNGLVDTSRVSAISIAQDDSRVALNAARKRLENSVFSVVTGQNVNFTIQYPLKKNVSVHDFAVFLNQYITEQDNQLLFESWLESDYPNEKKGYGNIYAGPLDHGAPYRQLTKSYANAYIPMNDSDKDGLWDFIENQIGSNMNVIDTDGDGVPDGSELLDDATNPVDATDYRVAPPKTDNTTLYSGVKNTIEGTSLKPIYKNPVDGMQDVPVTSRQAGNALVKLQGYDDAKKTYTNVVYGTATIPFETLKNGNFRIELAKDALNNVVGKNVVLVSYSPNGKNPAMSMPIRVMKLDKVIPVDPNNPGNVPDGYVTVTFDPGQGTWKEPTKPTSYYVQKAVEITTTDFQEVTDNLQAPTNHIFGKWDGFPQNGQFNADEQLTASYVDSREIIEVTPKDPNQTFNPENNDDENNSQKTPKGFVRVIFTSGKGGTFGSYESGQDKEKVAYDVKADQTWEKVKVPTVTVKKGYILKNGTEQWKPQLPETTETVTAGTYTAQYQTNGGNSGNGGHVEHMYYTLVYVSNGGTNYSNERYDAGLTVELNKMPVREGYFFTGWYADKELTDKVNFIKMSEDKMVYAGWKKNNMKLHIPDVLNGDDHMAYIVGYPDGTVAPNDKITRAEVAAIFYRLLNDDARMDNETTSNIFTDTSEGMWFNTAVSTIANMGIVKGRVVDKFEPHAQITRGEFAAICARFDSSIVEENGGFPDIQGHWAEESIERAAALGWVHGYMDGLFHPNDTVTRAEAMAMINRVLGRLPENEEDLLPDMKTWSDNADPKAWYYLTVQEATNGHTFKRKVDEVHEEWIELK